MREAVGFLTALGGARKPSPRALRWFPIVGAAIGLLLGGVWEAATRVWPAPVAAAVVVAADLAVTGLLHADGLADSADGLLPHLERHRRLEVMAAPDVGAFGVAVLAGVILLRWATLAAIRPAPLLLAGLWALSRTAMAGVVDRVPYARTSGLASAFQGSRVPGTLLALAVVGALLLGAGWSVPAGPVAVAAAAGGTAGVLLLARRRIGGYTGDVLGAAGMVGETVGLLVAAARW